MAPSFAFTKFLLSESHWLSSEDLTESVVSSFIKSALQFNGLLTSALQEVYGKPVSVEYLNQSEWADDTGILGIRRDVLLMAGDTPCVAALTLIPLQVIKANPLLAKLGRRLLGETMENRIPHQRGAFEFARIDANLVFPPTLRTIQFTWARRFRFSLESGDLLVTEVFFPGVLDRLAELASVDE
jgi:chorismate-pyruvate lyase